MVCNKARSRADTDSTLRFPLAIHDLFYYYCILAIQIHGINRLVWNNFFKMPFYYRTDMIASKRVSNDISFQNNFKHNLFSLAGKFIKVYWLKTPPRDSWNFFLFPFFYLFCHITITYCYLKLCLHRETNFF